MNYEQKYKEALEKARQLCAYPTTKPFISDLQDLFPELKESEDEKLKNTIIRFFEDRYPKGMEIYDGNFTATIGDVLAWLEKQGESDETKAKVFLINKGYPIDTNGVFPTYEEMYNIIREGLEQQKQNYADKVEPKFKVGDWVICCDYEPEQIINIRTNTYEMSNGDIRPFYMIDENHNIRTWSIKDAKDGDVLCTYECGEPKIVFIIKGTPKKHRALSYYCYYNIKHPYFKTDSEIGCLAPNEEDVKPATREQRNLLFRQMQESGYEWDAEEKELKKIEQTPVWTEDDDRIRKAVMEFFELQDDNTTYSLVPKKDILAWLKSLKERVQPKQGESEDYSNIDSHFGKPIDKVEPKFHVGDFIKNNIANIICKVITVNSDSYYIESIKTGCKFQCFTTEQNFHLWSIEDVNDGDVLKEESCIFIVEKMNPNGTAIVHCCLFDDGEFDSIGSTLGFDINSTRPATKDEQAILFERVKEAGYEWDKDKKELKKIEK